MKIYKCSITVLYPYLVVLSLLFFGPISMGPMWIEAIAYLSIILFILLLAFEFGFRTKSRSQILDVHSRNKIVSRMFEYLAPVVFFAAVSVLYFYVSSGLSVQLLVDATGEIRGLDRTGVLPKKIATIIANLSFSYVILAFTKLNSQLSLFSRLLYLASIGLVSISAFLQAGRSPILYIGVLAVSIMFVSRTSIVYPIARRWRVTIVASLVAILSLIFISFIALNRPSDAAVTQIVSLVEWRYGKAAVSADNFYREYIFVSLAQYLYGPFQNLCTWVVAEYDVLRISLGPLKAPLSRFVDIHSGGAPQTLSRYLQLGGQLSGWKTAYGTMIVWYGYFGGWVYAAAIGYFSGRALRFNRLYPDDVYYKLLTVWIIAAFYFSMFYFPNDTIFLANAIILFLLTLLFRAKRKSQVVQYSGVYNDS